MPLSIILMDQELYNSWRNTERWEYVWVKAVNLRAEHTWQGLGSTVHTFTSIQEDGRTFMARVKLLVEGQLCARGTPASLVLAPLPPPLTTDCIQFSIQVDGGPGDGYISFCSQLRGSQAGEPWWQCLHLQGGGEEGAGRQVHCGAGQCCIQHPDCLLLFILRISALWWCWRSPFHPIQQPGGHSIRLPPNHPKEQVRRVCASLDNQN